MDTIILKAQKTADGSILVRKHGYKNKGGPYKNLAQQKCMMTEEIHKEQEQENFCVIA
jgi:hypothetical protein